MARKATSFRLTEESLEWLRRASEETGLSQAATVETAVKLFAQIVSVSRDTADQFIGDLKNRTPDDRPLILSLREGWVTVAAGERLEDVFVHTWPVGSDRVAVALTTSEHLEHDIPPLANTTLPMLVIAELDHPVSEVASFCQLDLATLRPDAQFIGGFYRTTSDFVLGEIRAKNGKPGEPPRFT